ncbi:MAG: cytochrome c-type biogenesis CcmF C-terminal domain-containing protein [candidate division KSB1 bacterium]|nr:cytochrome c-type biogenesis CcmF C-terminal domain-containing protein [candidate division KSB1 bacterium]
MVELGYQSLNAAFVFSAFAALLYFLHGRRMHSSFIWIADRALGAAAALCTIALAVLLYELITHNFQLEYVARYSNRSLPWYYLLTALWAGQAGSLLLWAWLLGLFSILLLWRKKQHSESFLPNALGIMAVSLCFFLFLLVFKSNPFYLLPFAPEKGTGLNPLLQNPGMIFHPPSLYIGFVAYTVPFAVMISAFILNEQTLQWLTLVRRWSLFAWVFLTAGNILGMQWAYVELGWGGYWAWDPVENASLLPWLTGTAFLHSIIARERRDTLKTWSFALLVLTFALTIFGTFVTRSGLISSVHAFGVSSLGPAFLVFMGAILAGSLLLMLKRKDRFKGRVIQSWRSKESAFLLTNLILLLFAIAVLIGTLFPAISQAIGDQQLSVGESYYNRIAAVLGVALFLTLGVCTLLVWGRTSLDLIWRKIRIPGVIAVFTLILLLIKGIHHAGLVLAVATGVFVLILTVNQAVETIQKSLHTSEKGFFRGLTAALTRNKRRYGSYIVHLGVTLFFIGLTLSSTFDSQLERTLRPGESIQVGSMTLNYKGLEKSSERDLTLISARFDLLRNGRQVNPIISQRQFHSNYQPVTEVGIRSSLLRDIYVILADYQLDSQTATVQIMVNPMVLWIWMGGIIMVLGTLVSFGDKKRYPSAMQDDAGVSLQ